MTLTPTLLFDLSLLLIILGAITSSLSTVYQAGCLKAYARTDDYEESRKWFVRMYLADRVKWAGLLLMVFGSIILMSGGVQHG